MPAAHVEEMMEWRQLKWQELVTEKLLLYALPELPY